MIRGREVERAARPFKRKEGKKGRMEGWKDGRREGSRAGPIHRTEHGSPVHENGREEGKDGRMEEGKEVERVRFIGRSTARPFMRMEGKEESRAGGSPVQREGRERFVSRLTFHVSRIA